MGYSKDQLLSRLQDLQINFAKYEHPVVLTVEEQAIHVGPEKGALSKNLFLKDKKQKFYIVSALADTNVDMKVLSQRLGLGKGGLRMAPEKTLGEILQVPLGCVTPFSLVNESARHVSLLLDQGFKTQDSCVFHPLSNDMSIALNARDLDKFLHSIEKAAAYVDLEANPKVGKDQPPDLAALVPSEAIDSANASPPEATPQEPKQNHVTVNSKPTTVGKGKEVKVKPSNASTKKKSPDIPALSSTFADPDKVVEEMLEKVTSIFLSEGKPVDMEKCCKQLGLEMKSTLTMFKNAAYTEGFKAGTQHQPYKL